MGHAVTRGTSAQADIFPVIYAVQPRMRALQSAGTDCTVNFVKYLDLFPAK